MLHVIMCACLKARASDIKIILNILPATGALKNSGGSNLCRNFAYLRLFAVQMQKAIR